MRALGLFWRDPVLRLAVGMMLLTGTLWASFGPFLALLAVQNFALGDRGYAAVLAIATLAGVVASIWMGIRADQSASRRRMAIATNVLSIAGLAMMTLVPGQVSFVIFHTLIFPIGSTIFNQVLTLARLAAARHPVEDRAPITAAVRAATSLPFVIVLPILAVALDGGVPLTAIYPIALVFALLMGACVYLYWPHDDPESGHDAPSGLSLRAALTELTDPGLALRLAALGAIAAMPALYVMTIALILTQGGQRPASDPGLFFGLVAGAEVPAILLVSHVGRRLARLHLLLGGAALSAGFLLALPLLAPSPWVWALVLPLALAHGVLLPVPITYLQDLLANRPGTGTALLALQGLIASILAAGAFALGTALWGYGLVTILGAAIGMAGAMTLWGFDRGKG